MYAVGFINFGIIGMHNPMGNQGLQKLHNKTMRGWMSELQTMRRCVDEIFIMPDFTQEMCEMNQAKLWEYCYRNKIATIRGN
jgi:hypothetical protein